MHILIIPDQHGTDSILTEALSNSFSVTVASSRGPALRLDAPQTFSTMDAFDVVVNCHTPWRDLSPVEAIDYRLKNGGCFVELSPDPFLIDELLFAYRGKGTHRREALGLRGSLLLGAGNVPGLACLLARLGVQRYVAASRLEAVYRGSARAVLGAEPGPALRRLLQRNALAYVSGQRVQVPPAGTRLELPNGDAAVGFSFSDATALHWSESAADTRSYWECPPAAVAALLAAVRHAPRLSQRALGSRAPRENGGAPALAPRPGSPPSSPLELRVVMDRRGSRKSVGSVLSVRANDAALARAAAGAALVDRLAQRSAPAGVVLPTEITELDAVLARMRELGGPSLKLDLQSAPSHGARPRSEAPKLRKLPVVEHPTPRQHAVNGSPGWS